MVLPSLSRAARSQPCKSSKWGAALRLQKSPADYNCGGVKKRNHLRSFYPIPRADVFNTLNIKNSTLNIIFSPSLFALLTQSPATTAPPPSSTHLFPILLQVSLIDRQQERCLIVECELWSLIHLVAE